MRVALPQRVRQGSGEACLQRLQRLDEEVEVALYLEAVTGEQAAQEATEVRVDRAAVDRADRGTLWRADYGDGAERAVNVPLGNGPGLDKMVSERGAERAGAESHLCAKHELEKLADQAETPDALLSPELLR